ncbi:MAG: cell division protein FtsA [Candidatus Nomurabacteria bacterium]|nr:cell division protein FtsA [Candidatus Nomurabacteria bacterium]
MKSSIVTGIDIGSYATRVVISEHSSSFPIPRIRGIGFAETKGVRNGYVHNIASVTQSIARAIQQAQTTAKIKISRAFVSIGGISLSSNTVMASNIISKADGEVTQLDMTNILVNAEEQFAGQYKNRRILHTIPISYTLDNHPVLGNPVGMRGMKLDASILFISALNQHVEDLITAVSHAGVSVLDIVAAPVASSLVTLSPRQKQVGVLLVDIGSETVSMAVFERDIVTSLEVLPTGGMDITNDIALGFKVPLDEAETLKRGESGAHSKKKIDQIVEARLKDVFDLVDAHLKKIRRSGLLPAGIVMTGGGSALHSIEEYAKAVLRLPSKVASAELLAKYKQKLPDSSWLVAYGLCFLPDSDYGDISRTKVAMTWNQVKRAISNFFKNLLP